MQLQKQNLHSLRQPYLNSSYHQKEAEAINGLSKLKSRTKEGRHQHRDRIKSFRNPYAYYLFLKNVWDFPHECKQNRKKEIEKTKEKKTRV